MSEEVETGIVDGDTGGRGEVELGCTENDYMVGLYGLGEVDGLVDVDEIKASHDERFE